MSFILRHSFLKLVNCCEDLYERYFFWFCLLKYVPLEFNFNHISSCLQSRRLPEDPGVGHQSAGRQNHQCVLSWGVSCPCCWSALYGDLVFTRSRFESQPPQIWTRLFSCGCSTADSRGSVSSANSVFWKKSAGVFDHRWFFQYIWQLLGCLSVWKLKTRCFSDVSLKSQNVICVGVLISAAGFNGFRCFLLALVLACLLENILRIEVESSRPCKMVFGYD